MSPSVWYMCILCLLVQADTSFSHVSRKSLLLSSLQVPAGIIGLTSLADHPADLPDIAVKLRFLPKGGCMVIPIIVDQAYRYFAVVDTGSPFLTAPPETRQFTTDVSRFLPTTSEQYGDAVGGMGWRRASTISLPSSSSSDGTVANAPHSCSFRNVVLGVPDSKVIEDTGGIFFGMMNVDYARPSLLGQLGYSSFVLDYVTETMLLSRKTMLDSTDSLAVPMYDLSPYGPNLHHYACRCDQVVLRCSRTGKTLPVTNLQREVVLVVDTGLSGCVLSSSWKEDLPIPVDDIEQMQVQLSNGQFLRSQQDYWFPSCFRLPWFTDDSNHPHIIALGATFLVGRTIQVDTTTRLIKIGELQKSKHEASPQERSKAVT